MIVFSLSGHFWQLFAVDSMEPPPLMEGEGRSFRVLGFSQNQRAAFVQILMRLTLHLFRFWYFSCILLRIFHPILLLPSRLLFVSLCARPCFGACLF